MEPSRSRVLFGTDEAVAEPVRLRAGPLELTLQGGKLWQLRLGDAEIWHGVEFLYRDPDWCTPELVLGDVHINASDDAFQVRYEGRFPTSSVIGLEVEIEGTSAGHIRFSAEALPADDIQANRLGICVMHPLSAAGGPIEIEHIDGRLSRSTFPTLIPAWPPFMLIRAIRHAYAAGRWARCELSGDAFEIEDQRNNADASFKTYSRSNMMPRPYWLRAGVPIRQSVDLRLEAPWTRPASRGPSSVNVAVGDVVGHLPKIGIEISHGDVTADDEVLGTLRALRPALLHLSVKGEDAVDWEQVGQLLALAGAQLRLDVSVSEPRAANVALHALATTLRDACIVPESLAIFPSEHACIEAARAWFPETRIGGGTPHFFVQLNRLERLGLVDFLSFTTSSIVHGADDERVMLTLQSLPAMIETLRARHGALPIRIGPSSISTRNSPLGRQPATDGTRRVALARQDPRCQGLFGAAWCLGYIAQVALAGADAITLSSLTGESGIVAPTDRGPLIRFPTCLVLERVGLPARICGVSRSEPSRVAALVLRRDGYRELLLANLTAEAVDVELDGWPSSCPGRIIDAESWKSVASTTVGWNAARGAPVSQRQRLEPYALAKFEETL